MIETIKLHNAKYIYIYIDVSMLKGECSDAIYSNFG